MTRILLLALLLGLSGCFGIPAAVWSAGFGFGTAALVFDDDLLKVIEAQPQAAK